MGDVVMGSSIGMCYGIAEVVLFFVILVIARRCRRSLPAAALDSWPARDTLFFCELCERVYTAETAHTGCLSCLCLLRPVSEAEYGLYCDAWRRFAVEIALFAPEIAWRHSEVIALYRIARAACREDRWEKKT